jgi:hypothetical protein
MFRDREEDGHGGAVPLQRRRDGHIGIAAVAFQTRGSGVVRGSRGSIKLIVPTHAAAGAGY